MLKKVLMSLLDFSSYKQDIMGYIWSRFVIFQVINICYIFLRYLLSQFIICYNFRFGNNMSIIFKIILFSLKGDWQKNNLICSFYRKESRNIYRLLGS